MATYYGDNCDQVLITPECSDCVENPELGGLRRAGVVHKSYYPTLSGNPTNATIWQTSITAGLIKIIPGLRGDFDGGTPKMGAGYGDRPETLMGYDYKGAFYDPNYIDNSAFYESLSGSTPATNWHVAICTETQCHLSAKPVTFATSNPIAEDIGKNMEWKTDFHFFQKPLFRPFTMPVGIFDCAYAEV